MVVKNNEDECSYILRWTFWIHRQHLHLQHCKLNLCHGKYIACTGKYPLEITFYFVTRWSQSNPKEWTVKGLIWNQLWNQMINYEEIKPCLNNFVVGIIGDACVTDADCYDAFNNSACVTGNCQCNLGYYPNHNSTSCIARESKYRKSVYIKFKWMKFGNYKLNVKGGINFVTIILVLLFAIIKINISCGSQIS